MFTLNDAKEMVLRAIAEKGGEYRDINAIQGADCLYVHRDGGFKPGCIIGHALYYGGFKLSEIYEQESTNAADAVFTLMYPESVELQTMRKDMTSAAIFFLDKVQNVQDNGENWATAFTRASIETQKHMDEIYDGSWRFTNS